MVAALFHSQLIQEEKRVHLRDVYRKVDLRYEFAISEMNRQRETAHGEDFNKLEKYLRGVYGEAAEAFCALSRFDSKHRRNSTTI